MITSMRNYISVLRSPDCFTSFSSFPDSDTMNPSDRVKRLLDCLSIKTVLEILPTEQWSDDRWYSPIIGRLDTSDYDFITPLLVVCGNDHSTASVAASSFVMNNIDSAIRLVYDKERHTALYLQGEETAAIILDSSLSQREKIVGLLKVSFKEFLIKRA